MNRVLIIDGEALCMCPHCWTKEEIEKQYPQLKGMPLSHRLCKEHFEILYVRAMSMVPTVVERLPRLPYLQPGGESI